MATKEVPKEKLYEQVSSNGKSTLSCNICGATRTTKRRMMDHLCNVHHRSKSFVFNNILNRVKNMFEGEDIFIFKYFNEMHL